MTTDLFLSKKDMLLDRLRYLKTFSSVDVDEIGRDIFLLSADRRVREWAEEGKKIRRLDHEEIMFRGLRKKGQAHLAWYESI